MWRGGGVVDALTVIMGASVGFIAGYAAGYALRKMLNLFMLLLGSHMLMLMYLNMLGVIEIHWDELAKLLAAGIGALQGAVSLLKGMALTVPLAGFAAGFIVGLTQGD